MMLRYRFFFLFLSVVSNACTSFQNVQHKQFVYYENDQRHRIMLELPRHYIDEVYYVDAGGSKEQRYLYRSGAIIYITWDVKWETENQQHINSRDAGNKNKSPEDFIYKGLDSSGNYWKEVKFENVRLGYSHVPVEQFSKFEHAINAIRVK